MTHERSEEKQTSDVTAVVPVFNGERFLAQALKSIFEQSLPPDEVIVVDDGSTDGSAAIARDLGARVISQPNAGAPAAKNVGIAAATGQLIAFLDSDDLWTPDKTRLQVEYLRAHPEMAFVIGQIKVFAEPGFDPPSWFRKSLFEPHEGYLTSSSMIRKCAFDQVGGYDGKHFPPENVDWFARASDAGLKGGSVGQLIALQRIHGANVSAGDPETLKASLVQVMRDSIARKREAGNR